ncbi:leader peptide SpeFL [Shewanella algae]
MELYMKRKSKIMAYIRRTRHIMMPTHRDYFDHAFFFPATALSN